MSQEVKNSSAVLLFTVNRLIFLVIALDLLFMFYAIMTGFPPEIAGHVIKLKNLKTPFLLLIILIAAGLWVCPADSKSRILKFRSAMEDFAARPSSIWILFGFAAALFTWQQITEFLACEINFLPFSFYDYMLYYFFQG